MDLTRAKTEGKKWGKRVLIAVVVLGIIGPVLYTEGALHFSYSSGERTGFVQKLSKKGWICKTNEGELAMVNMAGQQATIFLFTVPDDKVSADIESYAGHRVELMLDDYARRWVVKHKDVCEATDIEHKQSPQLMDQRMACLEVRRTQLGLLAAGLADRKNEDSIDNAMSATSSLLDLDACDDPAL